MSHSVWDHLDHLSALLSFKPFGLFTDIDGTISEIAPTSEKAVVGSATRHTLARLAQLLDVVVVLSGRLARDAQRMVGLDELLYVGNHGLELLEGGQVRVWKAAQPFVSPMELLAARLRPWLDLPGVVLEEKGVTLAIHYRASSDPQKARLGIRRILEEAEVLDWFRVTEGKRVVEVKPPVCVDKGVALRQLIEDRNLRGAFVLGDDRTDVDAFLALGELRQRGVVQGAAVAVVSGDSPPELVQAADFTLQGVAEVERWLGWLAGTVTVTV